MTTERDNILEAMAAFIGQRSGLEACDYVRDWQDKAGREALASDRYQIARDGRHARTLLAAVRWRDIPADMLKGALKDAFSGRLSWDGKVLEYCTGQYFPTEYRKAACAVLATALWRYWRDDCGYDSADAIRKQACREFGRGIASRWFN